MHNNNNNSSSRTSEENIHKNDKNNENIDFDELLELEYDLYYGSLLKLEEKDESEEYLWE